MAQMAPDLSKSLRAAATISAYRVVAADTAASEGHVRAIQVPTVTSFLFGVAQGSATTDQAFPLVSVGFAKAAAGASVSSGSLLQAVTTTAYVIQLGGATAMGELATDSGGTIERQVGIALGTGTATNGVIEIFVSLNNLRIAI